MVDRRSAYPEKQQAHEFLAGLLKRRGVKQQELARRLYVSAGALARKLSARYPDRLSVTEIADTAEFLDLTAGQSAVLQQAHAAGARPGPPAVTGAVPRTFTSFVGREWEQGTVRRLLSTTRLLTLSGAGGCGKTRLSQAVAAEVAPLFRDGVIWVDLAPLGDPALVVAALAAALDVRERPGQPLDRRIVEALEKRELLLVLDNCEHLVAACARLADAVLRDCAAVTTLVTSREPLHVGGETVWRVPSLAVPPDINSRAIDQDDADAGTLERYAAVRLFCDRAAAVQPDFALNDVTSMAVARLCRRLDGMPLAIELAAAHAGLLSVAEIDAYVAQSSQSLSTGPRSAPSRHRTMQAALDWSYGLLTPGEQLLFPVLSVFAGGFDLDTALALARDREAWPRRSSAADSPAAGVASNGFHVLEPLNGLVQKSLVLADTGTDRARYRMLEPVRQYAAALLRDSGEESAIRDWHRIWYTRLAEAAAKGLRLAEQQSCIAVLELDHDNLRAALAWSIDARASEEAIQLGMALWQFWEMRGRAAEGRAWFERLIGIADGASDHARANVYNVAGMFARIAGDHECALPLFEQSLLHARRYGQARTIANTLNNLGGVNWSLGQLAAARALFEESLDLFRGLDPNLEVPALLGNLGMLANRQGDFAAARAPLDESLDLFRARGDRWGEARILLAASAAADGEEDAFGARSAAEASLSLYRQLGDERGEAWSLAGLATISLHSGDIAAAATLYEDALLCSRRLGDSRNVALVLVGLGHVALLRGSPSRAADSFSESLAIRRETSERWGIAECLEGLAVARLDNDQPQAAAHLLGLAEALRVETGVRPSPADQRRLSDSLSRVGHALGEAAFAAASADGAAMELERALAASGAPAVHRSPPSSSLSL